MIMDFANDILASIPFNDINTYKDEVFGLHRIETPTGCVEFIRVTKGQKYELHVHDVTSAEFIFVMGKGKVLLGDEEFEYSKGSVFDVPVGAKHGFIVEEDTIFISTQNTPIHNQDTGDKDIRYKGEGFDV